MKSTGLKMGACIVLLAMLSIGFTRVLHASAQTSASAAPLCDSLKAAYDKTVSDKDMGYNIPGAICVQYNLTSDSFPAPNISYLISDDNVNFYCEPVSDGDASDVSDTRHSVAAVLKEKSDYSKHFYVKTSNNTSQLVYQYSVEMKTFEQKTDDPLLGPQDVPYQAPTTYPKMYILSTDMNWPADAQVCRHYVAPAADTSYCAGFKSELGEKMCIQSNPDLIAGVPDGDTGYYMLWKINGHDVDAGCVVLRTGQDALDLQSGIYPQIFGDRFFKASSTQPDYSSFLTVGQNTISAYIKVKDINGEQADLYKAYYQTPVTFTLAGTPDNYTVVPNNGNNFVAGVRTLMPAGAVTCTPKSADDTSGLPYDYRAW